MRPTGTAIHNVMGSHQLGGAGDRRCNGQTHPTRQSLVKNPLAKAPGGPPDQAQSTFLTDSCPLAFARTPATRQASPPTDERAILRSGVWAGPEKDPATRSEAQVRLQPAPTQCFRHPVWTNR
ncbi:hypothetical protein GCM10022403_035300 [Streptomyces coacervatus]|uniref:Uncharacterized protein n=1 Tax=Streptomyces coacervatus TaxID=647381 RepID=A0ABP7HRW6_9ACTN